VNNLTGPHMFPVDPTLHWANPNMMPMMPDQPWPLFPPGFPEAQSPVPVVPHLHGGEVPSESDGHPEAWFTADGKTGPAYTTDFYTYPNEQQPTTLWYHDHALGITRINVMSGLAGFYLLRDPGDNIAPLLPQGKYEVPVVIQDRSFNADGSFFFDSVGVNPTIHPYWTPEFFGNAIMVNGKTWPNFNVERGQYRFRVLNGSNARFYNLKLSNKQDFVQIGSDGGYLPAPVNMNSLLLAPGERADILVDFSSAAPGTKIILENNARAPYPKGTPADPQTVGQIMQFTVQGTAPVVPSPLPAILNNIPVLTPNAPVRTLTLNEVMGPAGPVAALLNGQPWHTAATELPRVGATEEWQIFNLTGDTHPIHLHLVQFQVVSRQKFQVGKYDTDWMMQNGGMMPPLMQPTVALPAGPYLQGKPEAPAPNETGWKDTVRMTPGGRNTRRF
ncbi:copper oxidase, partial [bacterium]